MTKPTTLTHLRRWKQEQRKFATLTAYDASFARLFAEQGINIMLVGDSLGMTLQGYDSTLPVTVSDVAYHTRSVRRGAPYSLVIADMPFMSYSTPEQACTHAAELMRAGANLVKVEGGSWLCPTVRALTERAVPVCAHLGLTPQSVNILGGYKVQGHNETDAEQLLLDAQHLQQAGVQLLVLECIPATLAQRITASLEIPVIGIGAGKETDGQILVMHDALGITGPQAPKFAKNFLQQGGDIRAAVRLYVEEVEQGRYPSAEHSF